MAKETERIPEALRGRQNPPINNDLKIKRIYQSEPIDPTCWAYMRALRQFGATKKVYPVDPYVEVYQFQPNVFGLLTESADGMGDPWMYLVVGAEKAMLIDTGFGIGDLKGLCETLAPGRELIVFNTHVHPDHAGGNAQFDRVYCHEYDVPMMKDYQDPQRWNFLFEQGDREHGRSIWSEFDRADIIPYSHFEAIGCPDGFTFDLGGGFAVEVIHVGGHTAGSCALLERSTGSLFTGDILLSMRVGVNYAPERPYSQYMSVSTMRGAFERLSKRKDEFTHVYPGHFATDLENITVDAMLAACEAICADPVGNASYRADTMAGTRLFRYVEGLGTIAYAVESV